MTDMVSVPGLCVTDGSCLTVCEVEGESCESRETKVGSSSQDTVSERKEVHREGTLQR